MSDEEIRADERRLCAERIERFASEYVDKWERLGVDVKAQGWSILKAAHFLRAADSARENT